MNVFNVMIVEDDPMAQKLLEIFVDGNERYQVAHVIESAAMAEFYCVTNPIDLILMDVCTAMNASGLEAAEKIKEEERKKKEEETAGVDPELLAYINTMIEARRTAKAEKNFAEADRIRVELLEKGITLIDTREGTKFTIG